jgi:hypothetical protein
MAEAFRQQYPTILTIVGQDYTEVVLSYGVVLDISNTTAQFSKITGLYSLPDYPAHLLKGISRRVVKECGVNFTANIVCLLGDRPHGLAYLWRAIYDVQTFTRLVPVVDVGGSAAAENIARYYGCPYHALYPGHLAQDQFHMDPKSACSHKFEDCCNCSGFSGYVTYRFSHSAYYISPTVLGRHKSACAREGVIPKYEALIHDLRFSPGSYTVDDTIAKITSVDVLRFKVAGYEFPVPKYLQFSRFLALVLFLLFLYLTPTAALLLVPCLVVIYSKPVKIYKHCKINMWSPGHADAYRHDSVCMTEWLNEYNKPQWIRSKPLFGCISNRILSYRKLRKFPEPCTCSKIMTYGPTCVRLNLVKIRPIEFAEFNVPAKPIPYEPSYRLYPDDLLVPREVDIALRKHALTLMPGTNYATVMTTVHKSDVWPEAPPGAEVSIQKEFSGLGECSTLFNIGQDSQTVMVDPKLEYSLKGGPKAKLRNVLLLPHVPKLINPPIAYQSNQLNEQLALIYRHALFKKATASWTEPVKQFTRCFYWVETPIVEFETWLSTLDKGEDFKDSLRMARNEVLAGGYKKEYGKFTGFIKQELTDGRKVKDPRLIQSTTAHCRAVLGPVIYTVTNIVKKALPLAKNSVSPIFFPSNRTANDYGNWFSYWYNRGFRTGLELDGSRWDGRLVQDALKAEFKFYENILPSLKDYPHAAKFFKAQINTYLTTRCGLKAKFPGTRKSGTSNTTIGNTVLGMAVYSYVLEHTRATHGVEYGCHRALQRGLDYVLIQAGDDTLILLKTPLSEQHLTAITDAVRTYGIVPEYKQSVDAMMSRFCSSYLWPARVESCGYDISGEWCDDTHTALVPVNIPERWVSKFGYTWRDIAKAQRSEFFHEVLVATAAVVGADPVYSTVVDKLLEKNKQKAVGRRLKLYQSYAEKKYQLTVTTSPDPMKQPYGGFADKAIDGDVLVDWPSDPLFWQTGNWDPYCDQTDMLGAHMSKLRKYALKNNCQVLYNPGPKGVKIYSDMIDGMIVIDDERHMLNVGSRSYLSNQPVDWFTIKKDKDTMTQTAKARNIPILRHFTQLSTKKAGLFVAQTASGKTHYVNSNTSQFLPGNLVRRRYGMDTTAAVSMFFEERSRLLEVVTSLS